MTSQSLVKMRLKVSVYHNPYTDQDFFSFFSVLFSRLFSFFYGKIFLKDLATDEIQLVVLICVAAASALVGTFLVLRRMAMLANALSHTVLLGIVIAYLLCNSLSIPSLMTAALITGIITTFFTEFLNKVVKLQEDASIGLVFSCLFALGILLLTLFSRNVHVGAELIMGNVDALQKNDIKIVAAVLGVNGVLFLVLYYGFKITTFDPTLARTFGFSPIFFNYLLMVQTSATVVGAFRAVGVLMVLAFLVLPPLTARIFTHRLTPLIGLAAFIGVLASFVGVSLSRHILTFIGFGVSTGGIVVIVLGIFYIIAILYKHLVDFSGKDGYDLDTEISSGSHESIQKF
jgi:manganese/zinc/iron transport system permease protein